VIHFGANYYPEHWPEERWSIDADLMQAAGFNTVRMAEFAWSTLEPRAGCYDFAWLDRAIEILAARGIRSVLGTPTAAPPAWLIAQFPDILPIDQTGRRVQFGNRCHYCVTSPDLAAVARRIADAMGQHFGANPNVIGWQIDNEYNRVCYCERCQHQFQKFLADKYGSFATLNQRWSTAYWSQTYSAWDQIPIPNNWLEMAPRLHNPGLILDHKHFITACYRKFQQNQIAVLQPQLAPGMWITHNFMGWYDGYDHYGIAQDLDRAAWDWYVPDGHHDYLTSGAAHDLTRGFKRQNFWLIETQPGATSFGAINNALNKGEARAMAWHAVAHGADAILYWQWRSAYGGQEQYFSTLIDQSGAPRPFYAEAQQLGHELAEASALLVDTQPQAEVAILNSYDSRWSIAAQPHHRDFDYVAHLLHYYRPLAARNITTDILSADESLNGYKLVIAPALLLLNEKRIAGLKQFVVDGGQLVLTIRTGMKDEHNALLPMRQPGPLVDLTGVEVEEYYSLDEPVPISGEWFAGTSQIWAERLKVLEPDRVEVLARYGAANGWIDGQPAITVSTCGSGRVYLMGAYLDDDAQQTLVQHIIDTVQVVPVLNTPVGVEAGRRIGADGRAVYLVINHEGTAHDISLPAPMVDGLSKCQVKESLSLAPYGIALLTQPGR
jgi:beta-galactosidase